MRDLFARLCRYSLLNSEIFEQKTTVIIPEATVSIQSNLGNLIEL